MVDSRQKGARAESTIRDLLKKHTKLNWQRTPGSGALNAVHKLKGDLYVPEYPLRFAVEVKHYADDHLTSKVLTDKMPQLVEWWDQTIRQATQMQKDPLLIFKFDRSKVFVAMAPNEHCGTDKQMTITWGDRSMKVTELTSWLSSSDVKWST